MSKKLLMNNYSENGLMPVMDGLVCWLDGRDGQTGDTIWKDRSGNGNHAVFINNKTIFENGKLILNGDNYAELPFGKDEDINKHSICIYGSKNTLNTYNAMFVACVNGNNQRKYIDMENFKPRFGYASTINPSGQILKINELNNLVLTVNSLAKLYCNGVEIHKRNIVNNVKLSSNFIIGTNKSGSNFNLMGSIATILIYDRPLTKAEIEQNYLYEQSIERGE